MSGMESTTKTEKPKPTVVRAMRSYHWTCPDCQCPQFAERSQTHVGECKRCGKLFTVAIVGEVT